MVKNIFYSSILLILVLSCQNDDLTPKSELINLTLSVSVPQSGGAKLKATYTGVEQNKISESGFLLSRQPLPNLNNAIIIESKRSGNQLESTIDTDLIYNGEYFVRAYIKLVSKEIHYSDEQSFVSLGSSPPVIEEVTQQAHLLDTITISGKNFTSKINNIQVKFGEESSRILVSSDSIIKCIVPVTLKSSNPSIEVKVYEKEVAFNGFSLFKPEIASVSSLNATFRDHLTIEGDHFDFEASRNKVYFGNIEAAVTYSDRRTLKIIVPDGLESSSEQIKIITQLQETIHTTNFQLIAPQISFVPEDLFANQEVVIQGAYFHPVKDKNKIIFEDAVANISSGDTETLHTKVPLGPFPRRKAIVKVQVLDMIATYEIELDVLDKWAMVSNDLPFRYYGSIHNAIVASNTAYIITEKRDEYAGTKYLWKFNPEDFSWQQHNLPFDFGVNEIGAIAETDGTNIYVYLPNNSNDFWEYNTTTSTWSKKANFIGDKRGAATHFSINGEIYIGLGVDSLPHSPISYNDFYKYSPSSNTWVQVYDNPFGIYAGSTRRNVSTFVINNIAYLTGGAYSTGDTDSWSYNPNSNTWRRIADFNSARHSSASFALNGFGYVTGGSRVSGSNRNDCWRYDPSSDSWVQMEDVGHIPRGRHFTFTLNGKAYVGGGGIYDSGGSNGYDLYEYIP